MVETLEQEAEELADARDKLTAQPAASVELRGGSILGRSAKPRLFVDGTWRAVRMLPPAA